MSVKDFLDGPNLRWQEFKHFRCKPRCQNVLLMAGGSLSESSLSFQMVSASSFRDGHEVDLKCSALRKLSVYGLAFRNVFKLLPIHLFDYFLQVERSESD